MAAPSDPVALAARMMEIDSTSGREAELVDWLCGFLAGSDWRVRRIPVTDQRDDVLATMADDPCVTLSTHLDTVPPYIAPRLEHGVLHGRGACDAKGIVASMICAAERLRDSGVPIALLFVVGEEVSHDGARAANAVKTTSRILINGEPTEGTLAVGTKGAIRVRVRTQGRAAHSAYPHLGKSAIRGLIALLSDLDDVQLPVDAELGETTVNVGMISGGVADNVVPPCAEARLMIRLVADAATVVPVIERWANGRADLEWGPMVPPVRLGSFPGFASSVAAFATDIPELSNWGTPFLYGPGSIHVAHRPDEHVRVSELLDAVDGYERIAHAALARLRG